MQKEEESHWCEEEESHMVCTVFNVIKVDQPAHVARLQQKSGVQQVL